MCFWGVHPSRQELPRSQGSLDTIGHPQAGLDMTTTLQAREDREIFGVLLHLPTFLPHVPVLTNFCLQKA